jgi:hypothetical protein
MREHIERELVSLFVGSAEHHPYQFNPGNS